MIAIVELPEEGDLGALYPSLAGVTISPWTRRWWNTLPAAYRLADRDEAEFTMLRYMEGAGSVAGQIQDLSNDWWDGKFTDPERCPPGRPLRWLARMMGVKPGGTDDETRARVMAVAESGRAPAGSRQAIADAVRPYLTGTKQVMVQPSQTVPFLIQIFVRADEAPEPGGAAGLAIVSQKVQEMGIAPAGYRVQLIAAMSTWDAWEADVEVDAGWDVVEANVPRWVDSDSAGVQLE